MFTKKFFPLLIAIFALDLLFGTPATAQAEELRLRLNKVFGYSSFGSGEIQGSFTLAVSDPPANLQKVTFYLDDQVMGEVTAAPFKIAFNTDSYPLGVHTLYATGPAADGSMISSNRIQVEFVTAGAGMQAGIKIIVPVLVLVVGAMLLSFLVTARGKKGTTPLGAEQKYGMAGGAICPQCQRPFPLHLFGINLGPWTKLDRCPHCGKFGLMRRRSLQELRAAEASEKEQSGEQAQVTGLSSEEKLRKELDDSRFQSL